MIESCPFSRSLVHQCSAHSVAHYLYGSTYLILLQPGTNPNSNTCCTRFPHVSLAVALSLSPHLSPCDRPLYCRGGRKLTPRTKFPPKSLLLPARAAASAFFYSSTSLALIARRTGVHIRRLVDELPVAVLQSSQATARNHNSLSTSLNRTAPQRNAPHRTAPLHRADEGSRPETALPSRRTAQTCERLCERQCPVPSHRASQNNPLGPPPDTPSTHLA